jgi:ABC-type dipeptide/oligopeptide/nickel transport system ATPase component
MADDAAASLRGLVIRIGARAVVDGVDLDVTGGRITALVGASGSGKTLTGRALLGMVDVAPGVVSGTLTIRAGGRSWEPYASADRERAFGPLRGDVIGHLPQDARGSLDPLVRVGRQVADAARLRGADLDVGKALAGVGLDPATAERYPHELSGGMAQRVAIAQALARGSRLLVADEPTSALDPTVQAEVLGELRRLANAGLGILFVTHDLRILPGFADEILVMDAGRIAEWLAADAFAGGTVTSPPARKLWAATRKIALGRLG